jgi:hypothetical protein
METVAKLYAPTQFIAGPSSKLPTINPACHHGDVLRVFPMKTPIALCVIALCGSLIATAQVPLSGCGCSVSSSVVSCNCASAVPIKKADGSTSKQNALAGHSEPTVTRIALSPGALLKRWVPGEDEFIIGEGGGELMNEAKSPPLPIAMSAGVVLFMPKNEPYELRNVGKQDVEIFAIRMHTACPASP